MRTRSHRLSAVIGIAALNAWLAACGEVLPVDTEPRVDTDPRQDGGIADAVEWFGQWDAFHAGETLLEAACERK